MNLILITILIGNLNVTAYRSVPAQTDDSPYITSTGEKVHPYGVAISRDLLKRWGGSLSYGDWVYIEGIGFKVINDTMNAKHKQRIDVWVETLDKEKVFHKKFKDRQLKVWLIRGELK